MKELIIRVDDHGERVWDGSPKVFETRELVRCKDCKWYDPFPMCKLLGTSDNSPDFFCAGGERLVKRE